MLTAHIEIGPESAGLLIFNDGEQVADINLDWSHGVHRTPRDRADVLLRQNGYRRTAPWDGNTTAIDVVGRVGRCSCWKSGVTALTDPRCAEHG